MFFKLLGVSLWFFLQSAFIFSQHQQNTPTKPSIYFYNDTAYNADIFAVVKAMYADLSKRDTAAFRQHFTQNANVSMVIKQAGKQALDYLTIEQFIIRMSLIPKEYTVFEEKSMGHKITANSQVAQVWSKYNGIIGTENKTNVWSGIDAITLLQINGTWLISSIAVSEDGK